MRKDITVVAEGRAERGKNAARRIRAAGRIPAVLYGAGSDSVAVTVSPKEINKILHSSTGYNTIFDLSVAGGERAPVMVVDWLHDPVKGNLLHVDLKRIDLSKRLHVKVPVHTVGDPVGVKVEGGVFELITREIDVECLPDEIPEHFTVDVSGYHLNQSLRAGDIPLTGSMKLRSPADAVIAHIVAVRAEAVAEVAPVAEVAAPAEPEVIKKGKKEEEGAAAKPAEKGGDKAKKK